MGISKKDLRRFTLKKLGDLRVCTATSDGATDRFIDTTNLNGGTDQFMGREVLFTGGTVLNIGEQRYVAGSSSANRALGFSIALPAATAVGDELELVNTRSIGYRFQDVHMLIDVVITSAMSDALVPTETLEETFASGEGIDIPTTWRRVEEVVYQTTADSYCDRWHPIPRAPRKYGNGWWIDRAARTINVTGRWQSKVDAATVRAWGLEPPVLLVDDTDETLIDPSWLFAELEAELMRARYQRQQTTELFNLMGQLSSNADKLRGGIHARIGPHGEWL